MNYYELIQSGIEFLIKFGFEKKTAEQDSEELLLSSLRITKTELIKKYKEEIGNLEIGIFNRLIQERANGKPLAYITHNAVFFDYNFFVNEATLIPRIDSEILVEEAINFFLKNKEIETKLKDKKCIKILDACCGTGCLGLSFVKSMLDKQIVELFPKNIDISLLDISSMALQVAKINAEKLGLNNLVNMKFIMNDILINGFGSEKYDIILCNPPYIKHSVIPTLDKGVKDFEPHLALDGGDDGLKFYKAISLILYKNLFKHGAAFIEIGFDQGKATQCIFTNAGFCVETKKDYGHQDRCLICSIKDT